MGHSTRFVLKNVSCLLFLAVCAPFAHSQPGENSNPIQALHDPDGYAWELFIELNSDAGTGDGRVVWETWKNANNNQDIFLVNGGEPPSWDAAPPAARSQSDFESLPLQLRVLRDRKGLPTPEFDPNVGQGNEVRMNRAAFEFVRDNELYNLQGQFAFFSQQDPSRPSGFPIAAKEIKAQWRVLRNDQDPANFHTAQIPGTSAVWGLTALHITTKDLPNWFWVTFEHKDNPGREATIPSVDRHGQPDSIKGTKWENYILRGTQIDFVTPTGETTILASSQIESGFQRTSSCVTCHSRATIGRDGNSFARLDIFESFSPLRGSIGAPDPTLMLDTNAPNRPRVFFQTDFVWTLARARMKTP